MKVTCYLTVSNNGAVKATKSRVYTQPNEISVRVNLDIPDRIFEQPQLVATLVVPADAALPAEIPVEVADNVKDAIEQATNLKVHLTVDQSGTAKE